MAYWQATLFMMGTSPNGRESGSDMATAMGQKLGQHQAHPFFDVVKLVVVTTTKKWLRDALRAAALDFYDLPYLGWHCVISSKLPVLVAIAFSLGRIRTPRREFQQS
jgi:hypothetical protein